MKKLLVLLVFLGLLAFPLTVQAAQDEYPKAEIFAGYQYLHLGGTSPTVNMNGWDASLTGNFNKYFGVTGDFSGSYKTISGVDVKVYSYTGGPVFSLNHEGTINPFVHALFGGAHASVALSGVGSGSENGFTMLYGGGVDVKMSKLLALRGQVDWVYYHFSGVSESKNVRISTGIVFRF